MFIPQSRYRLKQTDQEVSTKCSDDTRTNEQKINNWTNEKSHKFLECLNLTEIENINSEIDGTTVVTQETVDMIISKIGKVLINSAGNTFGFKVSAGKKSEHRKNKPWFDHDCKAARSEFRKMKRNKNKSPFHRALVSDAEKRYKNTMNKAHKKYRSDFRKKMDDLKQKDAKEFWRLLNENKSTAQPKIDFDKLVSYFKELNSDLRDDTEEQQIETQETTFRSRSLDKMKSILDNCGFSYLWSFQNTSPNIKSIIKQRLEDQFTQSWSGKDYCWNFDGYLAEIRDNQTDKYIKSLLEKDEDNNQRIFFIGVSDLEGDNRWIWANSRKPVTSTYQEHFNSSGGHCAAVIEEDQSTFRLHNLHCDRKLRFICEVDKIY
ncbi:Hypothetical predicted protein [Mytilus galloprovincialis]|uniref:C-type lectin domain-containing protein n=1 Tax=Mytilus galloprovincialis TaxID=29158 RepID=A0A8B6F358_MYTGA|nr:Hypothetical predicted protein [Mytilus galloprovincialis]